MVRPRAQAARIQPEVDWTGQMAEMRQLLQAQQQEMNALREQLARQNQAPPAGGEPAHENPPARENPLQPAVRTVRRYRLHRSYM